MDHTPPIPPNLLPQVLPRTPGDLLLDADPEPFPLLPRRTALIVVDMQNAYGAKGGYIDIGGLDVSQAPATTQKVARLVAVCRMLGITIVWFQNGWQQGWAEAGGPESPNHWKSNAMRLARHRPELRDKLITEGGWDFELLPGLQPAPEDLRVRKTRYGGFAGTTLEPMLRGRGIRDLLFCGIATNVCVESTLREAYHREFWPVLIEDACHQAGAPEMHAATVFNVRRFFGWVSTVEKVAALAA
jgi:ureidoacrylate peracid hydrolase